MDLMPLIKFVDRAIKRVDQRNTNIVVMCCTLNEERNIERYCQVYSRFADSIVICDGGSIDRTVELAKGFAKVHIVHFRGLMHFDDHAWTPLGKHHNFAYEAAMEHNPDWIITDECDSIPTLALQEAARSEMEMTEDDVIGLGRIYIVGSNRYYPSLSLEGYFGWAHRPDKIDGHYRTTTHRGIPRPNFPHPDTGLWHTLDNPFALLHYGWPDYETMISKTKRYRASGALPSYGTAIPLNAGRSEPLQEWAKWN
jgi:glycosyltransferase involved in cell wall biosynthesis